jgi:hypothetical protein
MRIVSLIVLLAVSWSAAAQVVWKYVDDRGVTHYTDQPVPGAEKIELRSGSATTAQTSNNAPVSSTRTTQQQSYRLFQITRPADQDSVVNTGGVLQVSLQLEPTLKGGHSISLYMDGKRVEGAVLNSLDYELPNVPRGLHTLVATITDEDDRRVAETSKVTFTMRQKSIAAQPPVGPTLRAPTKPPATSRPPTRSQSSFAELHTGSTAASAATRALNR